MWDSVGEGGSGQKGSLRHLCVNHGPGPPECHRGPLGSLPQHRRREAGTWDLGDTGLVPGRGAQLLPALPFLVWNAILEPGVLSTPHPRSVVDLGQASPESGGHGCRQGGCWWQRGAGGWWAAALGGVLDATRGLGHIPAPTAPADGDGSGGDMGGGQERRAVAASFSTH